MRHIKIKAFPEFKTEKIEEITPDRFKVYLREKASDNAANRGLLRMMTKHLGVEVSKMRIISGHKHQNKIIEIKED